MVEMELHKIIIDEKRQDQVIVLRERGGSRQIPIVIGVMEASSIKMEISGVETARPMTHDLLRSVIDALEARMIRLIIDDLVSNTFHAKVEMVNSDGQAVLVDARPSDGVALAVRCQAPIFVDEKVIEKAAVADL